MTTSQKNDYKFQGTLLKRDGDYYVIRRPDGSIECAQHNTEPHRTKQEFAEDADINNIMKRYTYGQLPDVPATVADFSQMMDYQDMLNATIHAREAFDSLPAKVRQRFGNNPQELIEFVNDSKNRDEAIELGLIDKKIIEPDLVLEELKTLNKNLTPKKSKSEE